jgi:hypothetical protein
MQMRFVVPGAILIITLFFAIPSQAQKIPQNTSTISAMTSQQIDDLMKMKAAENLSITDRIAFYSELFLGMPYSWTSTGDGEWALYESWPLMNLDSTNCMVYCEHVLALSISDSWDNFFNNLQQIRYQNGIIGMRTRNHYTMGDWLPENKWLLDDVSRSTGGQYTKTMTRTISHETFFKGKGITDLRYVKPDREITIDYIPMKDLDKIRDNLRNGDIASLLLADKTDIFSAHMVMVIKKDGKLIIRESSNSQWTTFDTPWDEWLKKTQKRKQYAGMAFMRIRADLNKPNTVVNPMDIYSLKKKAGQL